ncbi:MAG: mechanosensitive ion channel family protein, partial [Saprospiraceae bacterium]|nr:mechanosensitive ion channel family protein [Saprospiraceae bacterium]
VKHLARYLSIILVVWLARMMIPALQLPIRGSEFVNKSLNIIIAVMLMLIAMVIARVLRARARELAMSTESRMDEQILPIVTRVVNIVIVTITIIYILRTLNVNVTALIAGLSIGGLALALAAQDSVKNLIGSAMIFFDKPFKINDYIVGSGFEGEVTEIGFRSTRIKTLDTSIISVPNGLIANMSVTNMGVRVYRLFNIMLTVTYQTSPEQLEEFIQALRQLIIDHPIVQDENYYVHLREMGQSSINIMFRCYLDVPGFAAELAVKEELYLTILRMAAERHISFAYPTSTVFVEGVEQPRSE